MQKIRLPPLFLCSIACASLIASNALAQAWVPPKKIGYFSFAIQHVEVGDHLLSAGRDRDLGEITSQVSIVAADYAIGHNLAISGQVAFVRSKYEGTRPESTSIDDGDWHGTAQDARFGLRYRALNGPVTVTPFAGIIVPTHNYDVVGHASVGRNLNELQLGVALGRAFGGVLPKAYLEGTYSYSFVENVGDNGLDRHNATLHIGYSPSSRVSLWAFGTWTDTIDGIRWGVGEIDANNFHSHDQAAEASFYRAGGGVQFPLGRQVDLSLSVVSTVSGRNTHDGTGFNMSLGYTFGSGVNPIRTGSVTIASTSTRRP